MTKKLFIHIGTGKTGTSSIQAFLATGQAQFARSGFIVPGDEDLLSDSVFRRTHAAFFNPDGRFSIPLYTIIGNWSKTINENKVCAVKGFILTNEGFNEKHIPALQKLSSECGLDPVVVVYFRRQDNYIESSWRQWGCKVCDSIEEWIEIVINRRQCDWELRLLPWVEAFGAESIVIRPYELTQLMKGDVVADFADVLKLPETAYDQHPVAKSDANFGLDADLVEITRMSRQLLKDQNDNNLSRVFSRYLDRRGSGKESKDMSFISPSDRVRIMEIFDESNRRIASRFGLPERLFLEQPSVADNWVRPREMTFERFVPIVMEIFLNISRDIRR